MLQPTRTRKQREDPQAVRAQMLAWRSAGLSNQEIAAKIPCSRGYVYKLIGAQPAPPAPPAPPAEPQRRVYEKTIGSDDELRAMRRAGLSNLEIAEKLGCTRMAVYKRIGAQPGSIRKKRVNKQRGN